MNVFCAECIDSPAVGEKLVGHRVFSLCANCMRSKDRAGISSVLLFPVVDLPARPAHKHAHLDQLDADEGSR